jgi:hypothetical protein
VAKSLFCFQIRLHILNFDESTHCAMSIHGGFFLHVSLLLRYLVTFGKRELERAEFLCSEPVERRSDTGNQNEI